MVKFCPSCGTKLEREFNYCPSCGFDLKNVKENEIQEEVTHTENVIRCDNCGEENSSDVNVCEYCGAPLKGSHIEKVVKAKKIVKENIDRSKGKPDRSKAAPARSRPQGKVKELKLKNLLLIFGGVLIVVFIILWSSGLLSSSVPEQVNQNQRVNQNSGIDLNNIKHMNELEAEVKNNPDDTAKLLELAHLKNDSGLYEQAIVDYRKYLGKIPSDADARIDMGVCFYNLHNYDEAIKQMETAVKYSPKHQIGYLNLGIVNLTAGNFEKSKEWLKKAVEIDPNSEAGKKAQELLESHNK
jgi:tetratricopeptide (TPR) repeat protein